MAVSVKEPSHLDMNPYANSECCICGERGPSVNYGALTCGSCATFFKRAVDRAAELVCTSGGSCLIAQETRSLCRACRFKKCVEQEMRLKPRAPKEPGVSRQKQKTVVPVFPSESDLRLAFDTSTSAITPVDNDIASLMVAYSVDVCDAVFPGSFPIVDVGLMKKEPFEKKRRKACSAALSAGSPYRVKKSLGRSRTAVDDLSTACRSARSVGSVLEVSQNNTPDPRMRAPVGLVPAPNLFSNGLIPVDLNCDKDFPDFLQTYWRSVRTQFRSLHDTARTVMTAYEKTYMEAVVQGRAYLQKLLDGKEQLESDGLMPVEPAFTREQLITLARDHAVVCVNQANDFARLVPGFGLFDECDQKSLLTDRWMESWMIAKAHAVIGGQTYVVHKKVWMSHQLSLQILDLDYLEWLYGCMESFNKLQLDIAETYVVIAVALFRPGGGSVKNEALLGFLCRHYLDVLNYLVTSRQTTKDLGKLKNQLRDLFADFAQSTTMAGRFKKAVHYEQN